MTPYLLVVTVLVGGGYLGDLRVIAQEPSLEECREAKRELLALQRTYADGIACIRGTATWGVTR